MEEFTFRLIWLLVWILSFISGVTVLALFWKVDTIRLAGIYSIKPIIVREIGYWWIMPWFYDNYKFMAWQSKSNVVGSISYFALEMVLAVIIAYQFRYLLMSKVWVPRLFFVLDCFRCLLFIAISLIVYNDYPFHLYVYQIVWCFIYSVIIFFWGISINRKEKVLQGEA